MEAFIYLIIFIIGSLFGSFFTLAVYRIPLAKDITHEHSFCPKCNHKLGFWDMIPILSYVFLGGKCRYCKEKIRPRYVLLEIFSGLVFLLFALSIHINFYELEISKIAYFLFGLLYLSTLFLIAGIDKEKRTVQKSVLLVGIITMGIYMMYLYIVEKANIYRYVIYLFLICITLLMESIYLKKTAKTSYSMQVLALCLYTTLFTGEYVFLLSVIMLFLVICLTVLSRKIVALYRRYKKSDEMIMNRFPFAFYFCICNIIMLLVTNWYLMYIA